jgi:alanine racemase
LALFGGYPNNESQRAQAELRCAFRLRARVVRVERLRVGDSVSYGRNYVAEEPTWIATIPAGHVDGVPRQAVNGGRVLIRNQTYPVIGAVSASHCIVELGRTSPVGVGDVATIMGPDHEDIVPDRLSSKTGVSIYDLFMHLNPSLPRIVV